MGQDHILFAAVASVGQLLLWLLSCCRVAVEWIGVHSSDKPSLLPVCPVPKGRYLSICASTEAEQKLGAMNNA